MYLIVAVIVLAALLTPLAVLLIRYNRKRLHILRCVRSASQEQLEAIYSLLERLQPEPSHRVLARTNREATEGDGLTNQDGLILVPPSSSPWTDQDGLIPVPSSSSPWSGRVIAVRGGTEAVFDFVESAVTEPRLRGRIFRIVPMPPVTEADWDNVETVLSRFVEEQPELKAALSALCPQYPAELLQCLLSAADTFALEDQIQLGGSPSWVQDAEYPSCDLCRQQMSLIVQLPGTLLPGRSSPRGTFYFFGCLEHPDQTKTVAQFT
jgi:hypothetical protein